jgi:hypothetical protein
VNDLIPKVDASCNFVAGRQFKEGGRIRRKTKEAEVQSPPWMAKEERMRTKVLIRAQTNGIQVDILK